MKEGVQWLRQLLNCIVEEGPKPNELQESWKVEVLPLHKGVGVGELISDKTMLGIIVASGKTDFSGP